MKINQEESIKLYLRIKKPKIFENPYYDIDLKKNRFSLHNDNIKKSNEIFDINLDKIFTEDHTNSFIFKETCSGVIKECLNGISFCFISHGETISDKLNTLIGDLQNDDNDDDKCKGIFPRILNELYYYYNNEDKKINYEISINYSFILKNYLSIIILTYYRLLLILFLYLLN